MDDRRTPTGQDGHSRSEDEFRDLTQDLLPSPPAASATREPVLTLSSKDGKRKGPITTADLKHKQCWICTDGEDDQDAASVNDNPNSGDGAKALIEQRKFVHACQCTLVAHESVSY